MNTKEHHFSQVPKILLGLIIVGLSLWMLSGCKVGGSVRWETDRGIPFSSDDRAIAYRHHNGIFVARTQGDKHKRVFTAEPKSSLSTPHWAPGHRAVIFAVTNGNREPSTGLLSYTLWYWPAPEEIWTSAVKKSAGDSATLPINWSPADPRLLTTAHYRDEVQVSANALFAWHPDGNQLLFLDTDGTGLQTVMSLDIDSGERTVASPVRAPSLAFSISPNGEFLTTATRDMDDGALWLGPIGSDKAAWELIEQRPSPPAVPVERMIDAKNWGHSEYLYDLRPRLGIWSPDSRWLAHVRVPEAEESKKSNPVREFVLTPVSVSQPQQVLKMPKGEIADLHWAPTDRTLGLLSERSLLLVDAETGTLTQLSGALQVERFLGWSKPGAHLAYLTLAEDFDPIGADVPTGRVVWTPAARHNLMVARANGTLPSSRFSLMNVSSAQWSNQSTKLSFWATHLPTVSNLPPGDPAAVLDLDDDAIRWYPTDVAEYAQVGHYYLLNRQYADAIRFYSDALKHAPDDDEHRILAARIHLWRGLSRLAAGNALAASSDWDFFRKHILAEKLEIPDGWDAAVYRTLSIDQIFLSTLLSMGQLNLAVEEAARIVEQDADARRIQGLCYLALIDRATGHYELFTDNVVTRLVPEAMRSRQIPPEEAERLVTAHLTAALHPDNLRHLSGRSRDRLAEKLVELVESIRVVHPQAAIRLAESAAVIYRESGKTALEIELLKASAKM